MSIKVICVVGTLAVVASSTLAGQNPSKARLDAIWDAADTRIVRQNDIWFDDGDFPKTINLLNFQVAYEPHDYETATNLGWMYENVHDWDQALATYGRYRRENPQDKDAVLPEGQYYFMKRQYDKIPALLEPALSRRPHPNVYRILAHTYEHLKRLSDAERVWKEYIALQPGDATAKVNLARLEKRIAATKSR